MCSGEGAITPNFELFPGRMFSVSYLCRPALRRLFLPVHLLFLTPFLGHACAVAGDIEFQDARVVDHPINGRGRTVA